MLSALQSDLIFKVKRKDGKKILIYVLIEHKSFVDKWVLFQVLGYIVRINEREREIKEIERKRKKDENKKNNRPENEGVEKECITVVLPVILYHGINKWNIEKDLSALYCNADNFTNYIPEFDYELVNLSNYNDNEITGNVYLRAALLVMKHYHSDLFDEIFIQILSLLVNHIEQGSTIRFIATITLYSSSHKSRGQNWLTSNIEKYYIKAFGNKGGEVMSTVSNIWIEQGKKEGIIEKARDMVIDALKVKYKSASQSLGTIIQSIKDEDILNNLLREVILCNNITEFQHKLEKIRYSD